MYQFAQIQILQKSETEIGKLNVSLYDVMHVREGFCLLKVKIETSYLSKSYISVVGKLGQSDRHYEGLVQGHQ